MNKDKHNEHTNINEKYSQKMGSLSPGLGQYFWLKPQRETQLSYILKTKLVLYKKIVAKMANGEIHMLYCQYKVFSTCKKIMFLYNIIK